MSHAVLSPSGASRWLTCTPSARLEQQFQDRAGEAAAEGTLAHKLGENMIYRALKTLSKAVYEHELSIIEQNPLYKPEMKAYCEDYSTFVIEQYNAARAHTSDAVIMLEQRIDLTGYVPEGFGTGDVQIIADGTLHFIDLKYGKGVPVTAEHNEQLMLYALGAVDRWDLMYTIEQVRMTIYQPRLDNVSTFELTVDELREWGRSYVKPRAKLAFEGDGEFNPGEKQCKFCRAKATCKALADYNLQLAAHAFAEPLLMSDADVSDVLSRAKLFKDWIKAVEEHALLEAVHSEKQWPGYKLVNGRSDRKYVDAAAVIAELKKAGYQDAQIMKPAEILGITALQGEIGKKVFTEIVEPHLKKPTGAPVLVPVTDKRPAYSPAGTAEDAFKNVEIND